MTERRTAQVLDRDMPLYTKTAVHFLDPLIFVTR